jgi:Fe2+ or Zn2+ uptake regulation protein
MDKQRRNTRTKQLVIHVLENSASALCHEEIEKRLSEKVDRVTIYRILQGFCADGKVHKIMSADGKTFYALCQHCTTETHHDNHPHFHCVACDTIACLETPIPQQPLPSGYHVISATALLSGLCNKCSNKTETL